jgi:hypothetical protein
LCQALAARVFEGEPREAWDTQRRHGPVARRSTPLRGARPRVRWSDTQSIARTHEIVTPCSQHAATGDPHGHAKGPAGLRLDALHDPPHRKAGRGQIRIIGVGEVDHDE